ncbi:unnamed protein product [Cuscuta epithymum]|uniref:Uncharacterized protein n=1 Tax=Cuscuta epithymum TaxID=186058 RepID=A0AAV0F790_9ASTE|nr:unnamed protein product [Cuscuta epithymum]
MKYVLQPILERRILDHSIIHKAIVEFLSIANQSSGADVIQPLSSADLVWMIHTGDGSRIAILCVKHGSAKDRNKIIEGMKRKIEKIARDKLGSIDGHFELVVVFDLGRDILLFVKFFFCSSLVKS